ncbi:MAG TPA: glycoside hydrolase family 31 protein [Steroidobacteraceae bacterium]|nr:glycoside hydrolase family 31 protein [Steroidobacteraceae bacterium]
MSRLLQVLLLALCASSQLYADMTPAPSKYGVLYHTENGLLQIEFVTDRIVRVRATPNAQFSTSPSLMRVPVKEVPGKIVFTQNGDPGFDLLTSGKLTVKVNRETSAVTYFTAGGPELLTEDLLQPRQFTRTEVIKAVADPQSMRKLVTVDGERNVAEKYVQQKDRDAWKAQINWHFAEDEALYGLGLDESDDLNLRGKTKRLYQHNLRKVIPVLVSTHGYGLLFDEYSAMRFSDSPMRSSLEFDVVDDLDYYFIAGNNMDKVVAGYRQLTGAASLLPKWAYGYVQSRERYKSQDEIIATVKEFRQRNIPLDVIVQDWNYWLPDQWGGDPNPKYYPDFSALTKSLHELNAHFMISIWPNPSKKSTTGKALHDGGYMLSGSEYLNAFDPKARDVYWNSIWNILGRHGVDAWWCDSTEPDVGDWNRQPERPANADDVNIAALSRFIDPQFINAYALEHSEGIYENARKFSPDRRVLNLTRSGYAGTQRYGAMLWTGDISASWNTLAQQVVALQSFSASGNPWITFDIGGFFVKRGPNWFWRGDYDKGIEDAGYRELYTRWLQVGAFLPMFRSHGTDALREPWFFGEPGTPFYDAIVQTINLRYQLLPYMYSLAGHVSVNDTAFMRPVAFAFPNDKNARDLKTQFMIGDELLVAPVLNGQQFGPGSTPLTNVVAKRSVYLPQGAEWIDFWSGERFAGEQTIDVNTPIAHIPLLVKAGSIVPMGPTMQYTAEKQNAPIELRVYPGTDGKYSLYEDEGDGYGYEKKRFSTIEMKWDDRHQTLTIDKRKGGFPGMASTREFNVVLVTEEQGKGLKDATRSGVVIRYTGVKKAVQIQSTHR